MDASTPARSSAVEQFAALPAPIQEHLVTIGRTAAGLSPAEKGEAMSAFVSLAMFAATLGGDNLTGAAELAASMAHVLKQADLLSGSAAIGGY